MENKLISLADFTLNQFSKLQKDKINQNGFIENVIKYTNLLKQPLELSFFVPTDESGNVLQEPEKHFPTGNNSLEVSVLKTQKAYQQAKDRCLFEGFKLLEKNAKVFHVEHRADIFGVGYKNGLFKTIEDLVPYNLTLSKPTK